MRPQNIRNYKKCIVVLPEGERTEVEYLKNFFKAEVLSAKKQDSDEIIIQFARRSVDVPDVTTIVLKGADGGGWKKNEITKEVARLRKLLKANNHNLSYYDFWGVFDVDDKTTTSLTDTIITWGKKGKKSEIHSAITCPSFEAWLLAHFESPEKYLQQFENNKKDDRYKIVSRLNEKYKEYFKLPYQKQIPQELNRYIPDPFSKNILIPTNGDIKTGLTSELRAWSTFPNLLDNLNTNSKI